MSDLIIAACDGAAKKNPGPAAWAWVVADSDERPQRWEAGPLGVATNNVAELTALAEVLESTDPAVPLEVRMDSQYAMNAVTKWIASWKRNGWLTAAKKPVANKELVVRIDALLQGRAVTFRHVAAHQVDGDHLNAIADVAASDAATTQQPAGTAHGALAIPEPRPERMTASPAARPRKSSTAQASAQGGKSSTARAGKGSSGAVIKAKFPGRCHCQKPYAAGEKIAKNAHGWGHVECRES
ncbi:ribonuclease H [Streptomyces sp. NPDC056486]|uniref:ribonuclease H family protein n=1 Tax=Streptomyces sp. NPDC056486 TaxID=3345835 RepID=UPI003676372A